MYVVVEAKSRVIPAAAAFRVVTWIPLAGVHRLMVLGGVQFYSYLHAQ